MLDRAALALVKGHRVGVVDLPGFGEEELDPPGYQVEQILQAGYLRSRNRALLKIRKAEANVLYLSAILGRLTDDERTLPSGKRDTTSRPFKSGGVQAGGDPPQMEWYTGKGISPQIEHYPVKYGSKVEGI